MAVASSVIDGGVVAKLLLVVGLWLAGWGAARLAGALVPAGGLSGRLLAATIAVWNPYVAERLLQGHWSLLVGYGTLPWIALTVYHLRERASLPAWCALAFWIGLAGLTPTGTLLAAFVGFAALSAPGGQSGARTSHLAFGLLGFAALAALPWLVVSGGGSGLPPGDLAGVRAFAARAEPGLGTLGSLASLGGIWNAAAVPGSRTTLWALAFSAVLLVVVAAGALVLWRTRTALGLLAIAVAAVLIPALMATGPGLSCVSALIAQVPGLGIMRDGQKWVAAAMPGYAVAGAAATTALRGGRPARMLAAGLASAALVATLPDLAWGVGGHVVSVIYPAGWSEVAARINAEPHPVTLLPPETLREYPWGPGGSGTPVLDPFPRWVRGDTLASGDLRVDGHEVRGDSERGRRVEQLLRAGAAPRQLAAEGVGWVVVQSRTPGDSGLAAKTLAQLEPVFHDGDIGLYRVPGPWAAIGASSGRREAAIAAHLMWVLLLLAGVVAAVARVRGAARPPAPER